MNTILFAYAVIFTSIIAFSVLIKLILKLRGKYEKIPRNVQKEEILTIPFLLIGIPGMFGFVSGVAVFNQIFWQIYFILMLVYFIVGFKFPKMQLVKDKTTRKQFILINLVGLIVSFPMIYMLGAYAFETFPN